MIKIKFEEPLSKEWRKWRERCQEATEKIVNEKRLDGNPIDFDNSLYREMKSVYLSPKGPFNGKCAYCESFIAADQPGDIEHFRPKAEVTNCNSKVVKISDERGNEFNHPGYYWLAYDWRNLLPCCRDCNTPSKWKTDGKLVGKGNKFPVKGNYAVNPGDEEHEKPYLINPVVEDPSNHLEIENNGVAIWKTKRGEACIKILGLNDREALVSNRSEAYHDASQTLFALFHSITNLGIESACSDSNTIELEKQNRVHRYLEKLYKFKQGEVAYSAAGQACICLELPKYLALTSFSCEIFESLTEKTENMIKPIICTNCGDVVPPNYVKRLKERGEMKFLCACGAMVSLAGPKERICLRSKLK